jgi:hypothetical protein
MKNQKGFAAFILIALIALSVAGFAYYKSQTPKPITVVEEQQHIPIRQFATSTDETPTTPAGAVSPTPTVQATVPVKAVINKSTIQELPKQGDVFTLGDTITIVWNPALINVSTMYLIKIDAKPGEATGLQIYKRTYSEDPVSKNGMYYYKLPKDYVLYPGMYKVQLVSYGEKQKILMNNSFEIKAPAGAATRSERPFTINSISGNNSFYHPGDVINLTVDARGGDGLPLPESEGYTVSARIWNNEHNVAIATNASWRFDPTTGTWLVQTIVPPDLGTHEMDVDLYCGRIGPDSICAQKYGTALYVSKKISVTTN